MDYPERLIVLDEMFLHLESPQAPMHLGGIVVLEGPRPSIRSLRAAIASRLHRVERLRQRVVEVPLGLHRPVWVDDAGFDIANHVLAPATAQPGRRVSVQAEAAAAMSSRLERNRPLWDVRVVDGVGEDRWALVFRAHHCMVDGASAVEVLENLLDGAGDESGAPAWRPRREPTRDELLQVALKDRLQAATRGLSTLRALSESGRLETAAAGWAQSVGDFLRGSFGAPTSAINRSIDGGRSFEHARAELATLKRIGDATGRKVNDVVLAAATGGLRRVLAQRGVRPEGAALRALVPVSLRSPEPQRDGRVNEGSLGNRVSGVWLDLPVAEPDPLERLRVVGERMDALKSSDLHGGRNVALAFEQLPSPAIAGAARLAQLQRAFNVAITNVAGPRRAVHVRGRRVVEIHPLVPLAPNTALAVAALSYAGAMSFGILADARGAPDAVVLAEGIEKSIAELASALAV
jgi:diacylglycerol O-acyltransferase